MADHHAPAPVSPDDIARASANWAGFTKLLKVSVIAIIALLSLMALFLV